MTKDGRFSYSQIFSYLSDDQYPLGFSKADKLALRKTVKLFEAKGSDHYYCGGDENVYIYCNFIFIACVRRSTVHKCICASKCMRLRLVVEDTEQRRRIVSITHEDGHFGVNRTYDTKPLIPMGTVIF